MRDKTNTRYTGLDKARSTSTTPYPLSRLSPAIDLVDLARQVALADQVIASHTDARIKVIADQIRGLQEEARRILLQAKHDQDLHRTTCHFKRQPGNIYHLYERGDGGRYFSMLSPQEWGNPPHLYIGSYRLEIDQSWSLMDKGQRD